ncbi:hypothetical protein [Paucilactobacillus kaifaensis]|uniref:hypothetical protein n=1 Tax=Paucilactobacillus kaifaensis TaxID=2559921 RepID=UPI001485680F|nr:hypothetical protein [Paucilactobacillus kaifaensis]
MIVLESGTIINKNEIDYISEYVPTISAKVGFKSGNSIEISFNDFLYIRHVLRGGDDE